MNLQQPMSEEFANALDRTCGRMIDLGLEKEAMFWFAPLLLVTHLSQTSPEKAKQAPKGPERHYPKTSHYARII